MRIAVLGTGSAGRTIAARLQDLGHDVVVGTRDPAATLGRSEPDAMGTPPISGWLAEHDGVGLATFADAAAGADLVVNASSGAATLEVLGLAGAENLAGKAAARRQQPARLLGRVPAQPVGQGHRLPG